MKLAIIGSQSFNDYGLLCRMVEEHFPQATHIVSGGAIGADQLAHQFALDQSLAYTEYLPQWKRYGRAAGQIRNRLIIDDVDAVLAFWNGTSKGTRGALEYARKQGKRSVIVYGSSGDTRMVLERADIQIHTDWSISPRGSIELRL